MNLSLRTAIAWLAICLGGMIGIIGGLPVLDRRPLTIMDTVLALAGLSAVPVGIWPLPKDR